jgi:hypothetical protein
VLVAGTLTLLVGRTDRDQVEFWVAGAGWLVARVQANEDGTGIHVRPT